MDQEAIEVAGTALPDEHLQAAPAGEATKVEAKTETQASPDPAAQPADPATAQTPSAGNEPQDPDAHPQNEARKGGVQKRIDELTRERYEAKREAEFWRQQVEAKAQQPEQQPAKPAPKLEEFADVNQFLEARDAWVMEQAEAKILGRLSEAQRHNQAVQQQQAAQIAQQQVQERFKASEFDARSRYADYDAAVSAPAMQQFVQQRPDVLQAVIDSPHGPDVGYFLAKNPARLQQIASLHPVAAAREIGRIEQMFMGQKQPATTQAPPPPRTVGGEARVALDPSNMTMKEYRAWRAKQR